jgi:hypothetical protein
MSDKTVDATDVKVISLLDVFPWILTLAGFGKGIGAVLSQIAATTVTEAKTASEAVLNALAAGKDVIAEMCSNDFKRWINLCMSEFIQEAQSQGWTVRKIMRELNKVVGKQHALDGKLLEALVIIALAQFLGKENLVFSTQTITGSRLGGHTDVEVAIGDGRFLLEPKSFLGVDWKRAIIEHAVQNDKGETVQQPFFLITPSVSLKAQWVEEMKNLNCQPVSISPSVIDGVIHLDALVAALKKEIDRVAEQKKNLTV